MAELTVVNYLGALQADPYDDGAYQGLQEALRSGEEARVGPNHLRHLQFARRGHEVRGEAFASARLIEIELSQPDNDDPTFSFELWKELGRLRRDDLMDDAGAREAYQRALSLRPGDEEIQRALDQIAQTKDRWRDLVNRYTAEAREASDAGLKASLLVRAAMIVWQYQQRGKNKDVDKLFREALRAEPKNARAVRLYEITLRSRKRHRDVAKVLTNAMKHVTERDECLGLALSAARVFARDLEDGAKAVECYGLALDFDPANAEALGFMGEHFTAQEAWDHLVALYDDGLKARDLAPDAEANMLLQAAVVYWRKLDAPDKAEPYFERLRKLVPSQPTMLEFFRARMAEGDGEQRRDSQSKMLSILTNAQRAATTDDEKLTSALEIARLSALQEGSAEKAMDAYKAVLRHDPHNEEAREALKQLYRQAGKWNSLVEQLRSELDQAAESDGEGRLAILRELLPVYRDQLQLDVMVLNTYNAILDVDPTDAEAMEHLAEAYERMGRYSDLLPVLQRKAEATEDPEERVALWLRIAGMWIDHFSNYNQAAAPLEQVLELDPTHREALAKLKQIYEKKRAWRPLFEVGKKELALIDAPAELRARLVELAALAGDRLSAYGDAIALWKQALELDGDDPKGVDALERLAERGKDWATLAEVLERRVEEAPDDATKIKLLTKLGTTFAERANDPAKAATAWRRVLALDSKHGRALRTLRESYIAAADWAGLEELYAEAHDYEGLVDVLGNVADRADDPAVRIRLSFRAGEIYEEQLAAPQRAFRAYERVLTAEPTNQRAARALLNLYRHDEKWPKVAGLLEMLWTSTSGEDAGDRLPLALELVDVCLERLRDGGRAFRIASQAFDLAPEEPDVAERLERAVVASGDHEGLMKLYVRHADAAEGDRAAELRLRAAKIAAEQLGRAAEASALLEKVVEARPEDVAAGRLLENLYRSEGRVEPLRALLQARVEGAGDAEVLRTTLAELAVLEEEMLEDADSAALRYRAIREIEPNDPVALAALDRFAVAAGRHQELREILEARIAMADQPGERVALTLRLGELCARDLGDVSAAIGAFTEVLEQQPGESGAVASLEALASRQPDRAVEIGQLLEGVYVEAGAHGKLLDVLRARLSRTQDPEERRALRLQIAEVATETGDLALAFETLQEVCLDYPADRELWDLAAQAARQAGRHEALTTLYATLLDAEAQDADGAVELSERVARLYDEALAQPEKAEPFHRRVLAEDPGAGRPFEALKELYTNRERWDELETLYRERIAFVTDADTKLTLLLQVCFLFEELLDDVDGAIRAYQEVLELEPQHTTSRRALERLYTRGSRFRDLVVLLEGDLTDAEGKDAVELMFRLGELHQQKLSEPGLAVDRYAAVLDAQPTHLRAQEALEGMLTVATERQRIAQLLEPVYEAQGAFPELVRVLEVQLEDMEDSGTRVGLLLRVADVIGGQLRDHEAAFTTLLRALAVDPADVGVREQLAGVAKQAGRERERAEALERVLDEGCDEFVRVDILRELAALYDTDLSDFELADRTYTRLLAEAPDNPDVALPAARALERLHIRSENYEALARDLRSQVALEDDPETKRSLLARLADIAELKLDNPTAAIAVHRERLDNDPADAEALVALTRLYERSDQWALLIETLQSRDAVATDDAEARSLLLRTGELYADKLGDQEGASAAYSEVVSRFGPDRESLGRLAVLYRAREQWPALLETLQSDLELIEDAEERVEVRFQAADLMRLRTAQEEEAVEAYREILLDAPEHEATVAALSSLARSGGDQRVRAAETLVAHYESRGDHLHLAEALLVVADSHDPAEALSALRRAAEVTENALSDSSGAFEITSRAVRASLSEPDLAEFLDQLDRLAEGSRRWSEYGALLREVAPDVLDEEQQLVCMMRAALVARDHEGEPERARAYFSKVLEIRPDHREALNALQILHERAGDYVGLLEVLRRKVEVEDHSEERVALLMRQAELCAGPLDDVDAAIGAYEEVLHEHPAVAVFEGLGGLYRRTERMGELAAMYERQLEADVGDASRVLYHLGVLYQTHLNDAERALEFFRDALERSPTDADTCAGLEQLLEHETLRGAAGEFLEPVYLRRQDWQRLVVALEAQLDQKFDAEDRKPLLTRLTELHEVQLEDLDGALEIQARMFRDDPGDAEVIENIERLARVQHRTTRVAEIFEAELESSGVVDDDHVALAVRAAEIRAQHAEDLERAARLYGQALAFDPTRTQVANALEKVFTQCGDHQALRSHYRNQADVAESEERRVRMLQQLAILVEREFNEPDGAATLWSEVLAIEPTHPLAIESLDRLLVQQARWNEVADHLRHCIEHAESGEDALEIKIRLGGVLYEHLDDVDGAIDLLDEITQERPGYAPALRTLEGLMDQPRLRSRVADILQGLYEGSGQWRKQVHVFERRLEVEPDPHEKLRLLGDIAQQYEEAGGLPAEAFAAWSRALAVDPTDANARDQVERLAEQRRDWDGLVRSYERALGAVSEDFVRASLLGAMARVHDEQRGDLRAAIATYERLLSVDPEEAQPLSHLESLHLLLGDWAGVLDVTQRKFERSFDPEERAMLARRAGSILEEMSGDTLGAIESYRRALGEFEDDAVSLAALDRLYSGVEDWENLATTLQQRLQFAEDSELRVDVAMRLGEVLSARLSRRIEAIDAYARVLEEQPAHAQAHEALSALYEAEAMWPELLDGLRQRADLTEDTDERVRLTFRAGRVLEEKLRDAFEAIECHRSVLELAPGHEGAIEALMALGQLPEHREQVDELLEPVLREHGRWDDLAELMSRSAVARTDPHERQMVLTRLAEVHEQGRQDLGAAFDTYCEALVADADEPSLADEVERLAGATGAHDRAADAFAQRAGATTDDEFALSLLRRLAHIAERELQDVPRAVEALAQAAERSGGDPECLAELDRLYTGLGDWRALAEVLERRIEVVADDGQVAELFVRLAELRAKEGERRGALEAYRDALERSPVEPRAVAALEAMLDQDALAPDAVDILDGVYRQAGDLTRVAGLYETRVRLAETPGEKVALLVELAGIWERDLGRAPRALEALREAFAVDPLDAITLDELERVAAEGAGFDTLRGLVEPLLADRSIEASERRDLGLRAAGWYTEQLDDAAAAEACLRSVLAADPESPEAHGALVALLAADSGRVADLVKALQEWAEREPDQEAAKERLFEAGGLAERAGDIDGALRCYKRVYSLDPGNAGALDQLIRIREGQSSWSHVAELLEHRIEAEFDAEARVQLRHRAAKVRIELQQEPAEAERLFLANLEDDPTDIASMDVLGEVYEKAARWDDLRQLLERRLDVLNGVEERVTVRVRLARLAERQFGQTEDAIEQLNEVLMDMPDHAEALETLERLLASAERWEEVSDLVERRIDQAVRSGDAALELNLRVNQGVLFETQLEQPDRAVDCYEQVLERDPDHAGALRALVRLHAAAGDAERGAETLEKLLDRTAGEERVETALSLAELLEHQLHDPERAEAALRQALDDGTRAEEVFGKLAALLERHEKSGALAELLCQGVEAQVRPEDKVALLQRAATLYAEQLADPPRAAACLERASQIVPDNRDILLQLCDLYIAAGRQADAVPVLEQIIASYGGRRAREVATLHHRLGRAYMGLEDPQRALQQLDAAFRIDLTSVPILVDLGMLCHQTGELERAQKTFRALLLQKLEADAGITKADVYYYLGDIASQLGDKLKAVSMLERALAEDRDHRRASESLAQLRG